MSSVNVTRKPSGRWEVRWRQGGRRNGRSFDRKGDADRFATEMRRRLQLGGVVELVDDITLAEFVEEWWRRYAIPNLKPRTRKRYGEVWATHLLPRIGGHHLREITPLVVDDLREQLHAARVGDPTIIKALGLLQGMLKRAVVWGRIESNPVREVDKPKQRTAVPPFPLAPIVVERIRAHMGPYDATLVSVMAYGGLRPDEAVRRRWRDVGPKLFVDAMKSGHVKPRWVNLLGPLAQDLAEWRMLSGRPGDGELVFPRPHGEEWRDHDWRNWRRRVYQGKALEPAVKPGSPDDERGAARLAGVTGDMRPYRLRGSFVSLLLYEGRSVAYVADQAGHTVQTLSTHYAGVMEQLEHEPRVSAEEAIRRARAALASAGGRSVDAGGEA